MLVETRVLEHSSRTVIPSRPASYISTFKHTTVASDFASACTESFILLLLQAPGTARAGAPAGAGRPVDRSGGPAILAQDRGGAGLAGPSLQGHQRPAWQRRQTWQGTSYPSHFENMDSVLTFDTLAASSGRGNDRDIAAGLQALDKAFVPDVSAAHRGVPFDKTVLNRVRSFFLPVLFQSMHATAQQHPLVMCGTESHHDMQVIAEHFYQEGSFEVGDAFLKEAGIEDGQGIRAPYQRMHDILHQVGMQYPSYYSYFSYFSYMPAYTLSR